ncbi:SchA/CurD [Streptomyces sp. SCA3-4]|uniref:SchA/CurD-like domain-containing protein n=1 Tax=Streptomyces sichuanensis TaxID=2871810 RepID=UPI001CE2D316|nr:SchA/CurD-like domain-containing protein [Streptomyces sichuanensis]MCA6091933.1 SchA/CurD [Streptomyces sichuanensis]
MTDASPKFAAVTWNVRPGTEEEVAEILRTGGRPDSFDITRPDGSPAGRLLATAIFMRGNQIVRVVQYEGELEALMRHMATQPAVQKVEALLDPFLEKPRPTESREGFRQFFLDSSMRCLQVRYADRPL